MSSAPTGVYRELAFPQAPVDRPYVFINMVATIDGKTISGTPHDSVPDLGSEADHKTLRQLEHAADAILIGAGNLRATPGLWYPKEKIRIVATRSGDLDYASRFFTDAPEKVIIAAPRDASFSSDFRVLPNDFPELFKTLRQELGVERLVVEGGSNLNGEILPQDLVDELFLTVSPKVKLGHCLPTYAGGDPLPRGQLQQYTLLESHVVGDEVFLRYRRSTS